MVTGLEAVPGDGRVNCSRQVQPSLKRIESPGLKLEELTLAIVSQGVVGSVPLLESLPTVPQLET